MLINLYGLTQDLRPAGLTPDVLRFQHTDVTYSKDELFALIERRHHESNVEFAIRITPQIAGGIAHLHWERYPPSRFHQQVPLWENFILWSMRYLTHIPEYQRYHFSSVEKSIERGIGICGDASILLSQVLSREGISNKIISMKDHVMVSANADGKDLMLDADFGVTAEMSPQKAARYPAQLAAAYIKADRFDSTVSQFLTSFATSYETWDGPQEFITKKYYFEKVSYLLKWALPTLLMLPLILLIRRRDSDTMLCE